MGVLRLGVSQLIGEAAEHAPAPRCVGQNEHTAVRVLPMRWPSQGLSQVGAAPGVDLVGNAFMREHVARIAVARHDLIQARRSDAHIALVVAVSVVVDRLAEPAQPKSDVAADAGFDRQPIGDACEVVAVSTNQRPGAKGTVNAAVHEQAGTDVAGAVDLHFEQRIGGDVAHRVVIEVAHAHAGTEQAQQGGPIAVHRQVENIDFVAAIRVHVLEQRYIAFQCGQQRGGRRLVQPPLQRGAQAIGVAIADIEALRHHFC